MHNNPTEVFQEHYDELLEYMTEPAKRPTLVSDDMRPF